VSGSPYYLPPERLLGTGEDAYSEIYSLGMVMYYALSGQTYFDANEVEALAKRHVSKVRLSVSSKLRGFREELVAVLSKMIKQEPEDRYGNFREVAEAIQAIRE
jgi:serine/threonine protein kinase